MIAAGFSVGYTSLEIRKRYQLKAKPLIIVMFLAAAALFAELPKVAVLDTVLGDGMDPNIGVGVTEKISEELVVSGKYTILDRTTVGQSLKEIEFQMSGLASDADIKKAGAQLSTRLGAAYVVVARATRVGKSFFITGKMIDIKTGEITSQASDQKAGDDEITLDIAASVGKKLAAGAKEPAQIPSQAEQNIDTRSQATPPSISPLRSHLTASYMYPLTLVSGGQSYNPVQPVPGLYGTYNLNVDLHWLQSFGGLYFCVNAEIMTSSMATDIDSRPQTMADASIGAGWGFPLLQSLQAFGGVFVGYNYFLINFGTGPLFGAEAGMDWNVVGPLTLSIRISAEDALMNGLNIAVFGLSAGLGFMY
jgi:TolB-like protein